MSASTAAMEMRYVSVRPAHTADENRMMSNLAQEQRQTPVLEVWGQILALGQPAPNEGRLDSSRPRGLRQGDEPGVQS
jgi:hypothetical protein